MTDQKEMSKQEDAVHKDPLPFHLLCIITRKVMHDNITQVFIIITIIIIIPSLFEYHHIYSPGCSHLILSIMYPLTTSSPSIFYFHLIYPDL